MSNIRDAPDVQYICAYWNSGVTYTNQIGDLPGYSNPFWYNPKGIANILSLLLVHKHHIVTYNSQYDNEFVFHSPQRPTFKMKKAGLSYHDIRHLLKNKKNAHIMVNNLLSPIPKVEGKKKQYTARDINRDDRSSQLQYITSQPVNKILYAFDNNILQNLPILWEYFGISEDIYGPSVIHLQGKKFCHKFQYV